jgi:hypothetical protein
MQEREVVLTKLEVDARPVLTVCQEFPSFPQG